MRLVAFSAFLTALGCFSRSMRSPHGSISGSAVSAPVNQGRPFSNQIANQSGHSAAMRLANGGSPSQPAPMFSLVDQDGRTHNLSDYRGRPVVLVFYPRVTPTLVSELASIKETVPRFDRSGAKVFGISDATQASQKALHDRERLPFPLLFDPQGRVAAQYRVLDGAKHVQNCTIVVDASGWITLTMLQKDIRPRVHGMQILDAAQCSLVPMPVTAIGRIGSPGSNFILPRVDTGASETLYGDRTARATVVFFISSKCPCSQGYDARMKALARRYTPRTVRFLAVVSSADETVSDAARHKLRAGLPFPVLRDAGNVVADQMEARITPEAFLLDAQGILRYHGRIDDDRTGRHIHSADLASALDAVLTGKHPVIASAAGFGCAIVRKRSSRLASYSK